MNISKRIGFNIATNVASNQKNARSYEIIVCKIGIITSFIYSQTNPLTKLEFYYSSKYIFYSIYVNFIHLDSISYKKGSMDFYDLLLTCNPIFAFTWIEIKYQELKILPN